MIKSSLSLLLMFNLGIVTIITAHAQDAPSGSINSELDIAAKQKIILNAHALVKAGKFSEAYQLLLPYQTDYAGDTDYDYLLGIVALDSGKPTEAIFALERVLAVNPGHLQARAEIARAYLATGEIAASQQEFETVQQQNPPKEVSATIQKYLDIIATSRSAKATSVQGYIEGVAGYDSNVNSATANSQFAIPAFGGALSSSLSEVGVEQSDKFGSVATGFNIRHAVSQYWALIGGANFNQRMNSTWDIFDTKSLDGSFGASLTRGDNNYSAMLQLQSFELDNNRYRNAQGMTAQWQSNLSNSSQASTYLQYTYLSYPDHDLRDADRYVVGAAYGRSFASLFMPTAYVSGYGGKEKERADDRPYLGHTLYGVRMGGELKFSAQTTLLATASIESRKYGGPDPLLYLLFLVERKDRQSDVGLGISHALGQYWTVNSNLNYTHNNSNIILNEYDRTVFSIGLRRNFN